MPKGSLHLQNFHVQSVPLMSTINQDKGASGRRCVGTRQAAADRHHRLVPLLHSSQVIMCLLPHTYEVFQAERMVSRSNVESCLSWLDTEVLAGSSTGMRVTQGWLQQGLAAVTGSISLVSIGFFASGAGEPQYLSVKGPWN